MSILGPQSGNMCIPALGAALLSILLLIGCTSHDGAADGSSAIGLNVSALPDGAILAHLEPMTPAEGRSMRFSPKAASVALTDEAGGLEGHFVLGSPSSAPLRVRLEKTGSSAFFDVLSIDVDRDGSFDDNERFETSPKEIRNKMWSSFDADLTARFGDTHGEDVGAVDVPYPVSLWYVEDPREDPAVAAAGRALRFTRRGWMQGVVMIDGTKAHVRLADADLDGAYTTDDAWALALPDSMDNLFDIAHNRPGTRHAWLGNDAYLLAAVDSTGDSIALVPTNPGVTRAQEREDDDQLAVDRRAPHSGGAVSFGHDFAEAEARARDAGARLFVDFETVWCGPCKTMDEWVYTADAVVSAAQNVVSVKVDGDDHPELVDRFEVVGYPTMLLVASDGSVLRRRIGYQGVDSTAAFLASE